MGMLRRSNYPFPQRFTVSALSHYLLTSLGDMSFILSFTMDMCMCAGTHADVSVHCARLQYLPCRSTDGSQPKAIVQRPFNTLERRMIVASAWTVLAVPHQAEPRAGWDDYLFCLTASLQ